MNNNTPPTQDYEHEPALTIGDIFANKALIKPAIAAAVAVGAGLLSLFSGDGTVITAGDDVVENISTLVMFAAIVYAPIAAKREQKKLATEQAKETRAAVYSPATTKRLVKRAVCTGETDIDPPPAT